MTRTALIAGATGLIGSHLLRLLLADSRYERVLALGRRAPALQHPRLSSVLTDLGDPDTALQSLQVDDAFCTLGTTLAKAGSRKAFTQVDYGMVVGLATAARRTNARQFLLVSAVGADPTSISFYSRTKGRAEAAVRALGFPSLHIFQPSLLLGDRQEQRLAESLAQKLTPAFSPLLRGSLARYQPVEAETVARALHAAALRDQGGTHIHRAPFDLSP